MTKKLMVLFLILILITVVACVTPAELVQKSGTSGEETPVSEDFDEVTIIEDDLDTSSMDDLDQDLADITW